MSGNTNSKLSVKILEKEISNRLNKDNIELENIPTEKLIEFYLRLSNEPIEIPGKIKWRYFKSWYALSSEMFVAKSTAYRWKDKYPKHWHRSGFGIEIDEDFFCDLASRAESWQTEVI